MFDVYSFYFRNNVIYIYIYKTVGCDHGACIEPESLVYERTNKIYAILFSYEENKLHILLKNKSLPV